MNWFLKFIASGLLLLATYIAVVELYSQYAKIPTAEAASRIRKAIKEKLKDWFCEPEVEFVPTDAECKELHGAIDKMNEIPEENRRYCPGFYGKQNLRSISLELVNKNIEADGPAIKSLLGITFEEIVSSKGYVDYNYFILINEIMASRYVIVIVYYTTKKNKKEFQEFMAVKTNAAINRAQKKAAPKTDAKLDKELQELDDDQN